jgi:hypothetical protein
MSTGELACTYAALILFDDGQEVSVSARHNLAHSFNGQFQIYRE